MPERLEDMDGPVAAPPYTPRLQSAVRSVWVALAGVLVIFVALFGLLVFCFVPYSRGGPLRSADTELRARSAQIEREMAADGG